MFTKPKRATLSLICDDGRDLTPRGFYRLNARGMLRTAAEIAKQANEPVHIVATGLNNRWSLATVNPED